MEPVHSSAAQGYAIAAGTYARGRPDYPEPLRLWLRQELGLGPGRTCVDLGAGTGKFTRLVVATGARTRAVEPVAAMRERLLADLPGVEAVAATAQAMPWPDGSADAVVCAQSFHWFAGPEALAEIHRILRPGGQLGLVWNVRDESVDWVAELTRIITPFEGDTPRYHTGAWRRAFAGSPFAELEEVAFPHRHVGSAEDVIIGRTLSVSFIAALPEADRARVEAQLRALVAGHPDLRGRETVAFPYLTRAYRCTAK